MKARKFLWTLAFATVTLFAGVTSVMAGSAPAICGTAANPTLWAGQTIAVGNVTVSNDEENLYVTYQTIDGWYLKDAKLSIVDYEPVDRLNPGHAPYKSGAIANATIYTFTVPRSKLGTLVCDVTPLWLQAKAEVVKMDNGIEIASECAYGGDITYASTGGPGNPDNSWYGNINYTVQCCDDQVLCYELKEETAWAAGTRYIKKGNWATFTPYVSGSTVTLFAGQNMTAGTVTFAPVDGNVKITITLNANWVFADVDENVKIQDYAAPPPSGNPVPGLFAYKATASDNPFEIVVPENNFYGVHVDVGYLVEVECTPVE